MTNDGLLAQMAAYEQCVLDRDRQLAESVLHPDYALVTTNPALMVTPRTSWLALLPDYIVHSWAVEEHLLDVRGGTAVAFQRIDMKATVLGTDRSGLFLISDVWLLEDDWRVWRRHSTAITAAALPAQ
ncbi:MAG: nuclear transport factor 2 family protein [Pseudolysinimonas sp.]